MEQSEGQLMVTDKFHKKMDRFFERFKDIFTPTRKFEDTFERRRWRCLTQTETSDQWEELCEEIEEEMLEKYGDEESKQEFAKAEVRSRSEPSTKSITNI